MKIRIKFRKYGSLRFVGHLDIMRFFQKAIRRAGIDVVYSEGFSPHQIMSFAAPLGVGLTSDGEYLDIEVNSTESTQDSINALNQAMTEGIEVLDYVRLDDKAKNAMSLVAAADYAVYYKDPQDAGFSLEELEDKIETYFQGQNEILVEKKTKKSERTVDIKPLVYAFGSCMHDGKPGFFLRLSTGSTDNIKPGLVLEDFHRFYGAEYDPFLFQVKRLEVFACPEGQFIPLGELGERIE